MGTMNKKTEMDKKDGDICQKKKKTHVREVIAVGVFEVVCVRVLNKGQHGPY